MHDLGGFSVLRNAIVATMLLISLISAGCAGKAAVPVDTPAPVQAPATGAPQQGPAPAPEPTSPAADEAVSSTVSLVDEPWITAPASVSTFAKAVRLAFSGPVDRASVEARLKGAIKEFPYTVAWTNDQELLLNLQSGCAFFEVGANGAKDARGRALEAAKNPVLQLHMPCHGSGYSVIQLTDGKRAAGFPDNGILVDSHPATGRLLSRNGTIYFLIENGTLRPLTHTTATTWARFLPDGNVLLSDGSAVRVVSPDGKTVSQTALPARVLTGALSADGMEAVLLLASAEAGATAQAVRLSLNTLTVGEPVKLDRSVEMATVQWLPGTERVEVIPERTQHWQLDLKTGKTQPLTGEPVAYSPDGRWVVDINRGGIFAAGDTSGAARVKVSETVGGVIHRLPLWAPDSRHVALPGGDVIDVETGKQIFSLKPLRTCAALTPILMGSTGSQLVLAYSDSCH